MVQKLELAAVVKALREELNLAKLAGEGHNIQFNVNTVDVEFQTAVELEGGAEGGGKIKFWVLDIDAKLSGKYKKSATHKITLSLTPVDTSKINPETGEPSDLLLKGSAGKD